VRQCATLTFCPPWGRGEDADMQEPLPNSVMSFEKKHPVALQGC
jgi:hypothetical protein